MSRSKKVLVSIIVCVVIIFCAAYLVAEKMITANISKTAITQKLEAATGYHVVIDGELHWQYSLRPSLDLDKITFFSAEKKQVMAIENPHISMALLPLLKKLVSIDFSFQDFQQNQLHFSKGDAHLEYKDNILYLTDFQSQFYQGHIQGKASVDLSNATPKFAMNLNASDIEAASLFADLTQKASISGKMNATTTLTSQGINAEQFIKNLNGDLSLEVVNGKLLTIHLGSVIPNLPVEGADFFDQLKIKAPIKNGIATTTLTLLAKNYRADGSGPINLNNQTLNIKLNVFYTRSQQTKNIALPVTISGKIASPSVSVDLTQSLGTLLKANEGKIKNKFNVLIQGL
ncbi:MAG: AsmA family protein [Pseudomonadota bacterium]